MGKIDDAIPGLVETAKGIDSKITNATVEAAAKYLGPNLFNKDASLVAYSDKDELARIRENFVKRKLAVPDSNADIDAAIKSVGEKYGMSVRNKKRAVVYALLMHHYGVKSL
jgi:hypothetical protein